MRKGFTLIELIISIILLALMIFGIARLFSQSIVTGRRAEKMTAASSLAQAQIESILALDYETITPGTFEARHNVFDNYDRQTEIIFVHPSNFTPVDNDRGLKRATITVFYPTIQGERSFELSTLISKR